MATKNGVGLGWGVMGLVVALVMGLVMGPLAGCGAPPDPGSKPESLILNEANGPLAECQNAQVSADASCHGCASVNASDAALQCTESPTCPFGLGTHTVKLTCSNHNGDPAGACIGTVTVIDDTPPALVCPDEDLLCEDTPMAPTATDNCGPAMVTCSTPPLGPFPHGSTKVHCIAQDASGNTSECFYTVTVH